MRTVGLLRTFDHSMGGRFHPFRRISDVFRKSVGESGFPLLAVGAYRSEWLTSQRS